MNNTDLIGIWKTYDQKMEAVLSINKEVALDLTKRKLNKRISALYFPKAMMLFLGLPYTLLIWTIAIICIASNAFFMAIGFGAIALIMTCLVSLYCYHIYLVGRVKRSDEVLHVQRRLSQLKLSSYNCVRLSIIQLPFWSICWMSVSAFQASPLIYGLANLLIFLGLSYASYRLLKALSHKNPNPTLRRFFLSGNEWEPIAKSAEILDQIRALQE